MKDFAFILPEVFLALTLVLVILAEITYYGERLRFTLSISFIGLLVAFLQTIISYSYPPTQIFNHVLSVDGFSLFFKLLFILLAILSLIAVSHSQEITTNRRTEFCALILASTLAMCWTAAATDLILAFLSLLFLNVVASFLAAYGRRSILSTEAAVKYFVFSVVFLALLLYAFAILFAVTHSLNIYEIHRVLVAAPLSDSLMLVIFLLSFFALSFQVGAFPMYFFMPDILEGPPTPVAGFLAVGTRAAGFAMMVRFLVVIFAQPSDIVGQWRILGQLDWTQIVELTAALTMGAGSLLAFRQKSAKRLVAYLVVAQTGYFLLGLLVLDEIGITSVLYNWVIELFVLTGIFYILGFLMAEVQSDLLVDLRGMLQRSIFECVHLVLFLLCLVGSPPMPGFLGKFTLLGAAIRHQRSVVAMVGALSMVLGMAAVIRLSFHLIGDIRFPIEQPIQTNRFRQAFLGLLLVPVVFAGLFADFVFDWAGQSLGFIFW